MQLERERATNKAKEKVIYEHERHINMLLDQVSHFQAFYMALVHIDDLDAHKKREWMTEPIEDKVLCKVSEGYLWYNLKDLEKSAAEKIKADAAKKEKVEEVSEKKKKKIEEQKKEEEGEKKEEEEGEEIEIE